MITLPETVATPPVTPRVIVLQRLVSVSRAVRNPATLILDTAHQPLLRVISRVATQGVASPTVTPTVIVRLIVPIRVLVFLAGNRRAAIIFRDIAHQPRLLVAMPMAQPKTVATPAVTSPVIVRLRFPS